jgi:hypothetical protein
VKDLNWQNLPVIFFNLYIKIEEKMKKLFASLAIFFVALAITGCINVKTKIKVNKDGSGTIEETMLMSSEMVQMMKQFVSGFAADSSNTQEFNLYNEEELKSKASNYGEGVQFLSGKELKKDGREGYTALYSFADLNKLRFDQNPDSKMPEGVEAVEQEPKQKEYITFEFDRNNGSEITINMPPASKESGKADSTMDMGNTDTDSLNTGDLSKLKALLKDFNISLVVETDGEIKETNASYADKSSVTLFDLNFNALKKINAGNIEEVKDLLKDVTGIKIETNNPVKIKFD